MSSHKIGFKVAGVKVKAESSMFDTSIQSDCVRTAEHAETVAVGTDNCIRTDIHCNQVSGRLYHCSKTLQQNSTTHWKG